MKYDWNDGLFDELVVRWRDWKKGFVSFVSYSIFWFFIFRDFGEVERVEFYYFVDVFEGYGYGIVIYFCFVNKEGGIYNSFVMGKL